MYNRDNQYSASQFGASFLPHFAPSSPSLYLARFRLLQCRTTHLKWRFEAVEALHRDSAKADLTTTWLIKLTIECPTPEKDPPKGPKLAGQLPIQMTSASKQHHDRRHLQELHRRDDRISRRDVQDKLWTCRERHVHVTGFNLQHTQTYCPAFPLPGCLNIVQATHLFQENIVQEKRNTRSWGPQSVLPTGPQAHSKIRQNLSTPTE